MQNKSISGKVWGNPKPNSCTPIMHQEIFASDHQWIPGELLALRLIFLNDTTSVFVHTTAVTPPDTVYTAAALLAAALLAAALLAVALFALAFFSFAVLPVAIADLAFLGLGEYTLLLVTPTAIALL